MRGIKGRTPRVRIGPPKKERTMKRASKKRKAEAVGRSLHTVVRLFAHFIICALWLISEVLVFLVCIPLFVVIEISTFADRFFHKPNPAITGDRKAGVRCNGVVRRRVSAWHGVPIPTVRELALGVKLVAWGALTSIRARFKPNTAIHRNSPI